MKLARYGNYRLGLVRGDQLCDVTGVIEMAEANATVAPIGSMTIAAA